MALRWDYKPAFPNAPEDSERALWTRRSVIMYALAGISLIVATLDATAWEFAWTLAAVLMAFDAGDHRNPYTD